MYRNPPVRTSHSATADLLSWSENPAAEDPVTPASRQSLRPADRISPAMFGAPMTEEEAESENKRKSCSELKLLEMNGSGIFAADDEDGSPKSVTPQPYKTSIQIIQQTVLGSQISFGTEGIESPRKPTSIAEIAKQRELSGTAESELEEKARKQISEAKYKELGGNDIFGPPPEVPPRRLAARKLELRSSMDSEIQQPRIKPTSVIVRYPAGGPSNFTFDEETVTKTAKKIYSQKFQDLTGNDIFRGDALPLSAEKQLSTAKLKEMRGSNIFADGERVARDYFGGVKKPPGGESTIALA